MVKRMRNTPPDGSYVYENVVIITDRDEVTTEASMLNQIMKELTSSGADVEDELSCNAWANCHVVAKTDLEYSFRKRGLPSRAHRRWPGARREGRK